MFKNRFLLILGVLSLLLVAMAVSRPFLKTPKSADLRSPPRPVIIPVTGADNLSDYFERHHLLGTPATTTADRTSDFYLRHPEWASNVQNAAIPMTGNSESPDYLHRHPELRDPGVTTSLTGNSESPDYLHRHPELRDPGVATPLPESLERPGMVCESPVDCR